MRIVGDAASQIVYDSLHTLVRAEFSASFDCAPPNEHIRTIAGREEGFYAWVAANWLADAQRRDVRSHAAEPRIVGESNESYNADSEGPVGIIDLGGTISSSISFVYREFYSPTTRSNSEGIGGSVTRLQFRNANVLKELGVVKVADQKTMQQRLTYTAAIHLNMIVWQYKHLLYVTIFILCVRPGWVRGSSLS
jgi:hypothetical protein